MEIMWHKVYVSVKELEVREFAREIAVISNQQMVAITIACTMSGHDSGALYVHPAPPPHTRTNARMHTNTHTCARSRTDR